MLLWQLYVENIPKIVFFLGRIKYIADKMKFEWRDILVAVVLNTGEVLLNYLKSINYYYNSQFHVERFFQIGVK